MNNVLNIYKPIGVTPLELINKLRKSHPKYQHIKISYAGRLDPLAHGVMLLLLGEENKNRQKYLNLDKEYNFTILFGLSTDTFDYLGLLQDFLPANPPADIKNEIKKFIKKHSGIQDVPYPPYSSKTINGVPLFTLAKQDRLNFPLPTKKINIYYFKQVSLNTLASQKVKKTITENISKISGDFRQKEILQKWDNFFQKYPNHTFTTANFTIKCSSGTYVRALAHIMGMQLGCGAIAYDICRTKVDSYQISKALTFQTFSSIDITSHK